MLSLAFDQDGLLWPPYLAYPPLILQIFFYHLLLLLPLVQRCKFPTHNYTLQESPTAIPKCCQCLWLITFPSGWLLPPLSNLLVPTCPLGFQPFRQAQSNTCNQFCLLTCVTFWYLCSFVFLFLHVLLVTFLSLCFVLLWWSLWSVYAHIGDSPLLSDTRQSVRRTAPSVLLGPCTVSSLLCTLTS